LVESNNREMLYDVGSFSPHWCTRCFGCSDIWLKAAWWRARTW